MDYNIKLQFVTNLFFGKTSKLVKSGSFFNFLSGNIIECVFLSCKSVSVVTVKIVLGDSRMSSGDSNL